MSGVEEMKIPRSPGGPLAVASFLYVDRHDVNIFYTLIFLNRSSQFVAKQCLCQDCSTCFQRTVVPVSSLCFIRTYILEIVCLTRCCSLTCCSDSTDRRGKSCCVLAFFAHSVVWSLQKSYTFHIFTGYEPKYDPMARINLLPTLPGRNLSRIWMSMSFPTLLTLASDQFHEIMETTIPPYMQKESDRRREFGAGPMYGYIGSEIVILRMKSQELITRTRISGDLARNGSHGTRCLFCVVLSRSAIANRGPRMTQTCKRCRQSGCAGILRDLRGFDHTRNSWCLESA